jgi:hypothetical protein
VTLGTALTAILRIARPTMPRRLGVFEAVAYSFVGSLEWMRRHALIVGGLERFREQSGRDRLTVLDFGGGGGALASALRLYGRSDDYELVLADLASEVGNAGGRVVVIQPDGGIDLPDDSVDVAVSSDVFEHIEPGRRAHWAAELQRVSRLGQIHTFPANGFDGKWQSTVTDQALDRWYRDRFGKPERWTAEHLAGVEPEVEEMLAHFPGAAVSGFANGAVWLRMLRNQLGPAGPLGRALFAARYLVTLRKLDDRPPFKGCLLTVGLDAGTAPVAPATSPGDRS